ncbi:Hsp20/alpha crystallin family protein [Flaviaesturariibacter flavus]|uniref:Hsp20/alpha crystallin family protein n=1 Tax=Flaviaesturariibacter flavus TaxID=2502780 RepID=A0A4R1BNB4_9BACT|nr:Hsp20/alpha crystallin family protein [Flaviaesturariibacter flavus]TCJ19043.1 Hsp20/alpha crystallin family protein [Flaviaesturariibacter flavus]
MTLVRNHYRPVSNSAFNTLFDNFFAPHASILSNNATATRSTIPVNVRETENAYLLDVVAPGFAKEDFSINLDQSTLTVSVDKKSEGEVKTEKFLRSEYKFASFKRSFTLDESIDGSAVSAQYVNGVLTLNLPKKAEVKPSVKQIEIQ